MRIEIMIDKEQKISQSTLDALESELYRNLRPLYPKTVIRIRKGSSNGVELTGLQRLAQCWRHPVRCSLCGCFFHRRAHSGKSWHGY